MRKLFENGARIDGAEMTTREGFAELAYHAAMRSAQDRVHDTVALSLSETAAVIKFWVAAGPAEWFAKRPEFDRQFRERFLSLHERVASGQPGPAGSPDESLALLLLLDQYPRNAFRNTARMYATDALARAIADIALLAKHDRMFEPELSLFFYLPFAHSEDPADQERSVALAASLPEPSPSNAQRHRDIIRRFGRFPHRNSILGRKMRADEQKFLDEGGYAG